VIAFAHELRQIHGTCSVAQRRQRGDGRKGNNPLEAFSDGVFAIAITLLVLELKVPHLEGSAATNGALLEAFRQQWPGYFALITSFFTIPWLSMGICSAL